MFREVLARDWGIADADAAVLEDHYRLLCRWNRVINLTGIVDEGEAVSRHYGEALFLASRLEGAGLSIADIGSGGGFPGFVLAVVRKQDQITLIEADQRKAVFLREASRAVPNIRVVSARAEDVSGGFDWVVSRAVSYRDLGRGGIRLGARAALLTGAEEPPGEWAKAWVTVPVPNSRQRFLRVSEV